MTLIGWCVVKHKQTNKHILWYHKFYFWYHKISMNLWYHKFDFVISQIRFCDIINSILWYYKFLSILWYNKIEFVISQNRNCDITKFLMILWYHNFDFVISQFRFCDITNSILWYHKFINILWYQKFDSVISQNGCGISFLMKNDRSLKIHTHMPVSLVIPGYPRTPTAKDKEAFFNFWNTAKAYDLFCNITSNIYLAYFIFPVLF